MLHIPVERNDQSAARDAMRDSASHSPDSAMLSALVVSLGRREDATFAARRLVAAVFQSVLETGVREKKNRRERFGREN